MGIVGVFAVAAVVVWAVALSVVDIRRRRLPNPLTLGGATVILLGAVLCGRGPTALLGAAALGGIYLTVHLTNPVALGGGDVKLALGLGALTGAFGPPVWALAALGGPAMTATVGIVALVCRRGAAGLPHGPSMCAASLAAVALAVF